MKVRYKKGKKFKGDRLFTIETEGEEVFKHARLFILINALAKNEYLIYKNGGWDEKGKDFLYEFAMEDAINLGKRGLCFLDDESGNLLKVFCERNKLMSKYSDFKQTLLEEFIDETA